MFAFNTLIFLFVLVGGLCLTPIWLASDMQLKNKTIITVLSVLSIFTFGICGMIAYVLIMLEVKQERILDDGSKYDSFLYNHRNHIYQNDMFGWGVYVLLYILEFLVIFMPVINGQVFGIELNLFNIGKGIEYVSEINEDILFTIVGISAYVLCAVTVLGVFMHIIVKDTRKVVFIDGILQGVYMAFTFAVAVFCYILELEGNAIISQFSDTRIQIWGTATFFMPLLSGIFMLIAVLPQTCSLMLAKSRK